MPTPEEPKQPRQTSVSLPAEHRRRLKDAQDGDGVRVSTRIQAMVQVWVEDPDVARRVDQLAQEFRRAAQATHRETLGQARSARWKGAR